MKKIIVKLVLFVIVSSLLSIMSLPAYAEDCPEGKTPGPLGIGCFTEEEKAAAREQAPSTDETKKAAPAEEETTKKAPPSLPPKQKASPEEIQMQNDIVDEIVKLKTDKNRCYASIEQYNITIIEEPLLWDQQIAEGEENPNFKTKICFRNTIMFKYAGHTEIQSEYSEICSPVLEEMGTKNTGVRYSCEEVMILFSKGGTTLIEGYISVIYKWGASLAGIIAVLVIVISGIQISASGGDSQAIEGAKTRIIKSLAGIAVLFLSGLILYTINPTFFN